MNDTISVENSHAIAMPDPNKVCLCCQEIISADFGMTLTKYTSMVEYPPQYEWQDNYCLDCYREMMLSLG